MPGSAHRPTPGPVQTTVQALDLLGRHDVEEIVETGFDLFVFICVHLCFHCFVATGTAGDGQADLETQMNTNEHK